MKILLVSNHFSPEINPRSFRATELARCFQRLGHELTICVPDHLICAAKTGFSSADNLEFIAYRTPFLFAKKGLRRLVLKAFARLFERLFERLYFPESLLSKFVSARIVGLQGYDLLISIAVPHSVHWGVADALGKNPEVTRIWAADCGDPFMGNGVSKRFRFLKYREEEFLSRANYICVPFEGAVKAYDQRYIEKFKVIPQGFDIESDRRRLSGYAPNKVPHFAYSGAIYPGYRDPSNFFEILCRIDIDFRFYVYTSNEKFVKKFEQRSSGRILPMSRIPRDELLPVLSKMDFLINFENSSSSQLPSKLIDYYIVGRPVLSVGEGDRELKEKVMQFLRGDYSAALTAVNLDDFEVKNVASRFLSLAEIRD